MKRSTLSAVEVNYYLQSSPAKADFYPQKWEREFDCTKLTVFGVSEKISALGYLKSIARACRCEWFFGEMGERVPGGKDFTFICRNQG